MRLWTIHPKYLDSKGLVALWRESLLARAVLQGKTSGYRHHPQLQRFQEHSRPLETISRYLRSVYDESRRRGYHFDHSKAGRGYDGMPIEETSGQLRFEWSHFLGKLEHRDKMLYKSLSGIRMPDPHPLFRIIEGGVRDWERVPGMRAVKKRK